jgi:predicted Zn-dependent peptidase
MLKNDPYNFKKVTLENGLTIFFSHIPYATKTVVYTAMSVGALHGKRGCSHFLEHFLIDETEKFKSPKEFDNYLESFGGRRLDLFTNYYKTAFGYSINSKFFKEGLVLAEELFFKPKLTDKNFEREKKIILEEIHNSIPRKKIIEHYEKRMKMLCDIEKFKFEYSLYHPYVTTGSPEEIEKLNLADIKKHYEDFYSINNFTIFIGSNLKEKEIIKEVKKTFAKYKSKKIIHPKNKVNKNQNTKTKELTWNDVDVYERKLNTSSIEASVSFPGHFKRVYGFARVILSEIFFEIVREKNGISYNPYVKINQNKWLTEIDIGFETSNKEYSENIDKARKIILETLDKAMQSKDIFERVKRNELRNLSYNESVSDIVYFSLQDYFVYGKINSLKDDKKDIENVEFKDVVKILKYIKENMWLEIIKSTEK